MGDLHLQEDAAPADEVEDLGYGYALGALRRVGGWVREWVI